ncbi:MAG: hypothetical protein WBD55_04200 [Dehalococcoidia bacterium]
MNLLRSTIVDERGAISFIIEGDALPALVKACAIDPFTLESMLNSLDSYYGNLRERVLNGLAIFDERNLEGRYDAIHQAFEFCAPHEQPVFRVVNEETREMSLRPVKAGAVIFNLRARRIVQIQNSYWEITRNGRGRVFDGQRFTGERFAYRLPGEWSLVP